MTQNTFIKTGVIGHPIAHSKSPLIHNYWIKQLGLSGEYKAIDLSCENLESGITDLIAQGYKGFNITVPHKVDVMRLCHTLDPLAKIIGAVNTLIVQNNGHLHGTNTDAFGFIENIRENAPAFRFDAGPALVLGAGGAARAVIQGLLEAGVPEIWLANRTRANAQSLLELSPTPDKIKVINWDDKDNPATLSGINLLTNTTALGMTGKDKLVIDLSALPLSALVNDIVYAPLMTDLLTQAKAQGNPIVTGIGMLLHQARPAFHHWYGIMPNVDDPLQKLVLS